MYKLPFCHTRNDAACSYFAIFLILSMINSLLATSYCILSLQIYALFPKWHRKSVKKVLCQVKISLKVFSFLIIFVSLRRISFQWANGSLRWFPITLWVNKSIRYYFAFSQERRKLLFGIKSTKIICDRWLVSLRAFESINRAMHTL